MGDDVVMKDENKTLEQGEKQKLCFTVTGLGAKPLRVRCSKKVLLFMSIVIVAGLGYGVKQIYDMQLERRELSVYRQQYAQQTEKLNLLLEENEKTQKNLSEMAQLEDMVRRRLEKDGEQVSRGNIDRASQEADLKGQGGVGKPTMNNLDALIVQNKLTEERLAYKRENLRNMLVQISQRTASPDFWPTTARTLSSVFGYRQDPFGSGGDYHPGIDIANDYGAPVFAAGNGYVEQAGYNGGYGRYIKLNHGNGEESAYGHMSALVVSAGMQVKKGDVIGYVGSSGYSTGPHLHYEFLVNGDFVDPLAILK